MSWGDQGHQEVEPTHTGDFTLKPPPEQALADMGISDDDVAITVIGIL